jgi:hypothetical protein
MIVKTRLSRKEFSQTLDELERVIELRPISRDALQQRIEHLAGSTEAEVGAILDGLRRGTYDHPSGWVRALRHLQANNRILYTEAKSVDQDWKSKFRSPRVRDIFLRMGIGLLFGAIFLFVTSPALKSCFLFFAAALFLMGAFVLIAISLPTVSENNVKRLAGAIAALTSSIYYISTGSSLPLVAFSWLMVILGATAFIATAQRLFLDGMVFRLLVDDFQEKSPAAFPMPLVYVLAQPGWGVYYSNRLSARLAQSLARYQFRPNDPLKGLLRRSGSVNELSPRLKRLWKGGALCQFLISDSMARFPSDFREWIAQNCAALVVVRLPSGFLPDDEEQKFEEQAVKALLASPGPAFDFRIHPGARHSTLDVASSDLLSSAADVSAVMGGPVNSAFMSEVISPFVQRLSATAIPVHWADFRLPVVLGSLKERWRQEALGPVADIYLRLRLAQSDVERFLILLEGIEVLMKVSAIVLIAETWRIDQTRPFKKIDNSRLMLGNWREILTEAVSGSGHAEGAVLRAVREFWLGPTSAMQADLIKSVSSVVGILSKEGAKTYERQLDWLNWLVSLRNSTRGHGVVEEAGVAPFWESLYNIFLEMSLGLEDLIFAPRLLSHDGNAVISLRGWLRQGTRSGAGIRILEDAPSVRPVRIDFSEGYELELSPFLLAVGNDVLVWDGWDRSGGDTFQVLSYATGSQQHIKVLEVDRASVSTLWCRKGSVELRLDTLNEAIDRMDTE